MTPLEALDAGATVVTVNNRLARVLTDAHAAAMLERGRTAWETPRVLPLEAFVAGEWQAALEDTGAALPVLLSPVQCRALWRQALEAAGGGELLAPGAAAAGAAAARELLLRHGASLDAGECAGHADAEAFAGWHEGYRARLEAGGWIDPPAAATRLAERVRDGAARRPQALMLAGFDRLTPQQEGLLAAYAQAGVPVWRERVPSPQPGAAVRVTCATPDEEIEAAARWVRALLDAGDTGPVGVVLPDLEARLDAAEACFEDLLHPTLGVAAPCPPGARAFNVSLGRPLAREPVVADALAALDLAQGRADADAAGRALLSPYLEQSAEERVARRGLEAELREQGVRAVRTRALARRAARRGAAGLARRLEALATDMPRGRAALPRHAERFAAALATLGWPAGSLDSGEYQAVEALRDQLEALAALGAVTAPCRGEAALSQLRQMLADTLHRPRGAPAPVQLLGVLEAAGMTFSKLWLAGMTDGAWPPPESPCPLLPAALQRRHGMPGASPAESLARARRITTRLLAAAPQVVVSHALRDGDTPLRVSPLVAQVPGAAAGALEASGQPLPDTAVMAVAPVPERVADWRGRAVGAGWRARGGSRVLTDQAACPFRAFARHRLGATGVARAPAPLDARARGNLAHRMMQTLFAGLADHAAIAALDAPARAARAQEAARAAVDWVLRRHPGEVPRGLAQSERQRLASLAERWLAREAERAPFQVEAVEQRRVVRVGGLRLEVQLDRVDRVDGRRLLLDYKTGRAGRAGWFGERPDEPQLPLYALALDAAGAASAPVTGVAFARLQRGSEGFEGVAEDAAWAPGLVPLGAGRGGEKAFPDMSALKAHWARVLTALAEEFAAGEARVDPKPQACRHCDVAPLCRVAEVRDAPDPDAEDAP